MMKRRRVWLEIELGSDDISRAQDLKNSLDEYVIDHRGDLDAVTLHVGPPGVWLKWWWYGTTKTGARTQRRTAREAHLSREWLPSLLRDTGLLEAAEAVERAREQPRVASPDLVARPQPPQDPQ